MIWINKEHGIVCPSDAFTSIELAHQAGFTQHHTPYDDRFLAGEKPASWDQLVLPDRAKFHKLASGSELWLHISNHAPDLAGLLYTAIGLPETFDNEAVLRDIRNMMEAIIASLGTEYALHATPAIATVIAESGGAIANPKLSDLLNYFLSESWFPFKYADIA